MVHKKQSNKKYSHLQNNQKLNLSDKKLNGPSEDNSQAGSVPEGHLTSCGKEEEKQKEEKEGEGRGIRSQKRRREECEWRSSTSFLYI